MNLYKHQKIIEQSDIYLYVSEYLEILLEIGRSRETHKRYQSVLREFLLWSAQRKILELDKVSRDTLKKYRKHLYHYRKTDGTPLTKGSLNSKLTPIRKFFDWCYRERYIMDDIAKDFEIPRKPQGMPAQILMHEHMRQIIEKPDINTLFGFRERVAMELMYDTAMRRSELALLKIHDIDFVRMCAKINESKNGQSRFVPISIKTLDWIKRYLKECRPKLLKGEDDGTLLLSREGVQFKPGTLASRIKSYIKKSGIDTRGCCHLFRHSVATQMLENGANIREIQVLLGHKELNTTEIYTRISMKRLHEVHSKTHPSQFKN